MFEDGVNDQHVREAQCDARVGDGRAEAADQVRGSLACAVHSGTVRRGFHDLYLTLGGQPLEKRRRYQAFRSFRSLAM